MAFVGIEKVYPTKKDRQYPNRLSLYTSPPKGEVSLEEFETSALERLAVLKEIEAARLRGLYGDAFKKHIKEICNKHIPLHDDSKSWDDTSREEQDHQSQLERYKDHISHFILRLAYCRTDDLRRWLLTQECALFRYRFNDEYKENIPKFLEANNLEYPHITREEAETCRDQLLTLEQITNTVDSRANDNQTEIDNLTNNYYKVSFEAAAKLIENRKVFIVSGSAYVATTDLIELLEPTFRERLEESLLIASRALPTTEHNNSSIHNLLMSLSEKYIGRDYSNPSPDAVVNISDLDGLAVRSFPLCMKNLHNHLKADHHLRHFGRMQYGLFLKAIGLSLDDALKFWRSEFSKLMPSDTFDKEYAYNIRHNYGKEGKRTDYTAYSCKKIITMQPGASDHHGCPFRNFDQDHLKATLQQVGVNEQGINEYLNLLKVNTIKLLVENTLK